MESQSIEPDLIDVARTAQMARLELTERETEAFQASLNRFLAYAGALSELDLDAVEPTSQTYLAPNVVRADVVQPSLPQDVTLSNAPQSREGLVIVPKILE